MANIVQELYYTVNQQIDENIIFKSVHFRTLIVRF